jgi:hypothetical protein
MKTQDIVAGELSDCFKRTLPFSETSPSSSNSDGKGFVVTKLDVLKYVQYLRKSTRLSCQDIYSIVSNHVEKLGITASRTYVKRYVHGVNIWYSIDEF